MALPLLGTLAGRPVDALLLSHAHLDHIGSLPVLMRQQPQARVFMTEPTAAIGDALLHNSVNVMTREREEVGVIYPLFTHRETDRATDRWQHCPLGQPFTVDGERSPARPNDELSFEYCDAGHVLGAAGILLRAEGRTVFYTGDVNFDDQTLTSGAVFPESEHRCADHRGDARRFAVAGRPSAARRRSSVSPRRSGGVCARRLRADAGLRARQDAGSAGDALQIQAQQNDRRRADLHRRVELEDDGNLRPPGESIAARHAAPAIVSRGRPVCLERQNDRRRPGAARPHLRALQRDDDAEKRSRIFSRAGSSIAPSTRSFSSVTPIRNRPRACCAGPSLTNLFRSMKTSRPCRCAASSSSSSSARTPRASRFSSTSRRSRRRKLVLVHGDLPAVEWMRASSAAALPESEVIVPPPGSGD